MKLSGTGIWSGQLRYGYAAVAAYDRASSGTDRRVSGSSGASN